MRIWTPLGSSDTKGRGKSDTNTGSGSCWWVWWPMWLRQIMWTLSPDKTFTCGHMPNCCLCCSHLALTVYCALRESLGCYIPEQGNVPDAVFTPDCSCMDLEFRSNSKVSLKSQVKTCQVKDALREIPISESRKSQTSHESCLLHSNWCGYFYLKCSPL